MYAWQSMMKSTILRVIQVHTLTSTLFFWWGFIVGSLVFVSSLGSQCRVLSWESAAQHLRCTCEEMALRVFRTSLMEFDALIVWH